MLEKRDRRQEDGRLRIACISRLTTACRYDVLIDAVAIAQSQEKMDIRITFIGDGPEFGSLKTQARRMGVSADFVGAEYDEERIASHLFDADVTVSPGKIGLTAMHSLMYGTPVISNSDFIAQMPEVEAVIPGFTGELFERDNVQDLADWLVTFKARYPDREVTRQRCFRMMDCVYNPSRQAQILRLAVQGTPAPLGDDALRLFESGS
jgi:glycosyltransferase involved in cell wall biosynthesis